MNIKNIVDRVELDNSQSVLDALRKMHDVPEYELHYYLVLRDVLQATAPDTRKIIMFAQIETDRRASKRSRLLAIITTVVSGAIGLLGVILGAYLAK